MRRLGLGLLAALLTVSGSVVLAGPAAAAGCRYAEDGVTVVVQFPGGGTQVGCAKGDPSSGLAALRSAGFSVEIAAGNGGGAVCKINKAPADQTCGSMPPADAYWSYWDGSGGSWGYQSVGAGGSNPQPGDVEGWRFGAGEKPEMKPPVAPASPAPAPVPEPEPEPEPTPRPSSSEPAPAGSPSASASASPSESPSASASPSPSATKKPKASKSPTPEANPSAYGAPAEEDDEELAPTAAEAREESGSSYAWVWGVGLIALLALAVGFAAVRRRR